MSLEIGSLSNRDGKKKTKGQGKTCNRRKYKNRRGGQVGMEKKSGT